MIDIDKLRSSLEQNKVFFETIAAFALTVMAIIISIAQSAVAIKQNELIELQVHVERQQIVPQLTLEIDYDFTEGEDGNPFAYTERIIVFNHGGIARSITSENYVFMDIYLDGERTSVPLIGYYWITNHTGGGVGNLLEFTGFGNNSKFIDLERGFRDLAGGRGQTGWIDLNRIVRLEYEDVFGETHVEYYKVAPITGGSPIPFDEGSAYKKQVDRYFEETGTGWPDLDDLQPEDIPSLMAP